ncbi:hypothetical protein [Kerstersia gyiorum]|uniref:hypothetical protein n=1 Tax=Kerstersia gyiorum TaxID=206506 RepID=UPI0030D0A105
METDLKDTRNKIAVEALQMVVTGSPVDEGTFRGSHRVSIDVENHEIPNTPDKSGQATVNAGLEVIATAGDPFQAVTIQTNLPYGEKLEGGHSKQAPAGVYRPAFATIRAKYAK